MVQRETGATVKTIAGIIQWEAHGSAHAMIGVGTAQAVCTDYEIRRFVREGKQVFVVNEKECDWSVEPSRLLKLIRTAEFKTLSAAQATKKLWMSEGAAKRQAIDKKIADYHARRKIELQKIVHRAVTDGEIARVNLVIKSVFGRVWPRTIKGMETGMLSPADTLRAFALDCIENSGSAHGYPIPEINRETAAEIARAVRSASRSTKKVSSALIDLCIALHWLPPHNWRDMTETEIASELKKRGFDLSPKNARTRANRLGLFSARESGPKAR